MPFEPLEQRRFRQFMTIDAGNRRTTYSRSCTIEPSTFILVRVPWKKGTRSAKEDRTGLTPDQKRFVEKNVTPGEHRAHARTD